MTSSALRVDAANTASAPGASHRIWQRSLLGGALSAAVNAIIFFVVTAGLGVTDAALDRVQPTLILSLLGALGATLVLAGLERTLRQPVRTFRAVALAVLLVSFVPDFFFTGATTAWGVPTLIAMHIVTAAIMVSALTLGRAGIADS